MNPEQTSSGSERPYGPGDETPHEIEKQPETTPAIYVACLAAYNNGTLHGLWIDATLGADEIHRRIRAMLATSPEPGAEEWAIHDYENFGPLCLGEYELIEHVAAIATHIQKHGEAFVAWLEFTEFEEDEWSHFTNAYLGEFSDLEAYVDHIVDEMDYEKLLDSRIPEVIRPYVNISRAAMARDLIASGEIFTIDGGNSIYIFNSRV
ncbi:antirestriction protein ArdA [Arthrobacter sp. RAF14]|uniref:antirestriction protein ArdA n=1 Tax=Arthrobacter sp. RAF14 TaxID=3233051 RepID=UPI003F906F7B